MKKVETEMTDAQIHSAQAFCVEQIRRSLPQFTETFPHAASEGWFFQPDDNLLWNWTNGFWTGEVWLAWELTHEEVFRTSALRQVDHFYDRIERKICVDFHDMGFLYSLSCVAAYNLTGSEKGKKAALMAADQLCSRFQPVGQFIQAWGEMGTPDNYRLIIDCLLNVPLLFWAARQTGDESYRTVAVQHIDTTMRVIFRPDWSTYHTFFFDPETGDPVRGVSHQGYRDESAWARGQAWGVYGCALAYRYTRNERYMAAFRHVTEYFLKHLPSDGIPYWDLSFTDGSGEPRDSSALAIAICGMLEMAAYLPTDEAARVRRTARMLMLALHDRCAVTDPERSNGLLLHGTYSKASPFNDSEDDGVDECNLWGDYFYLEALTRMSRKWNPYW